jgi:NAD(P)-dependent dehydrogenase (short-subunit alcohol dehydrogenase family)
VVNNGVPNPGDAGTVLSLVSQGMAHHGGSSTIGEGEAMPGRPVSVVTGASAGVGRATAVALARRGFDVALLARGEAGLAAAAKDVEAAGRRALSVQTDVAVWEEVDAATERIERELGEIDVWVNNAMTTVFAPLADIDPADVRRATEVTYLGQVHGTIAALRRMWPRDRGRIVDVGSALAYVGIPLQSAYCGAKFACRGFFESVRTELVAAGSNVAISMVHLPAVNTPQFSWCKTALPNHPQPVPPIYPPEVAAERIVDVVFDARRSAVLGAWNRLIVGGSKTLPSVFSQFAAGTAVDAQQTGDPVAPDRPSNLRSPVDDDQAWSAGGQFDDQARGVLEPSFLRSLPGQGRSLCRAVVAATRFKLRGRARRAALEARLAAGAEGCRVHRHEVGA